MTRRFLAMVLAAAVVALGSAAVRPAAAEDKIKLTIGWQPTMNGARFFVAQAEDLFAKEGLDVNLIKFTAGPPFFAAFESSSIDVGFMGIQPAVTAVAQGIPVEIVAVENNAAGAEGLVARQGSGIKKIADLRGKKVATKRGTSAYTALLTGLKTAGLKETDIQFIDLDVTALMPAFSRGDIQAAWYWEPWMGLLERADGHLVATDGDIDLPSGLVWVARDKWVKANPEGMQRLLRVLDEAADLIRTQPEKMAKLIAKPLGLTEEHVLEVLTKEATWPTNRESVATSYPFSMAPAAIKADKGMVAVLTDNAKFQKQYKIIDSVPDFTKVVDPGPLETYLGAAK